MRGPRHRDFRQLLIVSSCLIACATLSGAQASRTTTLDFATGSPFEDYLRILQVAGIEPSQSWSLRGLSPQKIARMAMADSVRGKEFIKLALAKKERATDRERLYIDALAINFREVPNDQNKTADNLRALEKLEAACRAPQYRRVCARASRRYP